MEPSSRRRLVGCLTLLCTCACSDQALEPTVPAPEVLSMIDSARGGSARLLTVELSSPGELNTEYTAPGLPVYSIRTPNALVHRVPIARVQSATTYQVTATPVDLDGLAGEPVQTTVQTGSLPPELTSVTFRATGTSSAPLTMLELSGAAFAGYVAIDERGDVLWFFRTEGGPSSWTRRPNGNFVVLDRAVGLREVTPLGQVLHTLPQEPRGQRFHHDVTVTPEGAILFLAEETRLAGDSTVVGESVWEWRPEVGEVLRRWTAFDHLSPAEDIGPRTRWNDWLHANSLTIGVNGDVLISLMFLDEIISLAPDFSRVNWRLGGPSTDYTLAADAVFSGQHTAAETSANTVLMFDNRRVPPDGAVYSRALEVRLDPVLDTAVVEWEFRPRSRVGSRAPGDGLPNALSPRWGTRSRAAPAAGGPATRAAFAQDHRLGARGPRPAWTLR